MLNRFKQCLPSLFCIMVVRWRCFRTVERIPDRKHLALKITFIWSVNPTPFCCHSPRAFTRMWTCSSYFIYIFVVVTIHLITYMIGGTCDRALSVQLFRCQTLTFFSAWQVQGCVLEALKHFITGTLCWNSRARSGLAPVMRSSSIR